MKNVSGKMFLEFYKDQNESQYYGATIVVINGRTVNEGNTKNPPREKSVLLGLAPSLVNQGFAID